MRSSTRLALLFAVVVLACGGWLGWRLSRGEPFETRLLALLPPGAQSPLVDQAVSQAAAGAEKQVMLLLGADSVEAAGRAAQAAAKKLEGRPGIAHVFSRVDTDGAELFKQLYLPYRYGLLTEAQRGELEQPSDQLAQAAAERMFGPVGMPRLATMEQDPLGFFSGFLLELASKSPLHIEQGFLVARDAQQHPYAAVSVELSSGGGSVGNQSALVHSFDEALAAGRAAGARETLRTGFLFHAEAAARSAEREMSTIGVGSLLGIILLLWVTFRSPRPLLLAMLPIGVGCLVAVTVGELVFGKLHLLTLVFGTSIIGVAVDYGFLFVAGRVQAGPWDAYARRDAILPALAMAVGTSLLAYLTLASLPFPLLRQMGVFSMVGLAAAWLTAVLWLPALGRSLPDASRSWVAGLVEKLGQRWPRVDEGIAVRVVVGLLAVAAGVGALRLRADNDVRLFYAPDAALQRDTKEVERLLMLPEAGLFFLLTASDEETLLQRSEALDAKLAQAVEQKTTGDFQSLSLLVPSQSRQQANRALLQEHVYGPHGAAPRLFQLLEAPAKAEAARARFDAERGTLMLPHFFESPVSTPWRSLWIGKTSSGVAALTSLSGVQEHGGVEALRSLTAGMAGVELVDHVGAITALMTRFERRMVHLMLLGYAVVTAFVLLRYRGRSVRVMGPVLLAALFTAGTFGFLGHNANLFFAFGLLLVLDMGVDYGIYLQEHRAGVLRVSLLGASLAAIATELSFGLLALSHTPALSTFGLTVLLGIGFTWLLAPAFRKRDEEA